MKLTSKYYKSIKIKKIIKKNELTFFFNGTNNSSNHWLGFEQELRNLNFNYYKTFNTITKKVLDNSTFKSTKPIIGGTTFIIKPKNTKNNINKNTLIKNFEPLLFHLLAVKLNDKIYGTNQILTNLKSLNYSKNKLILLKFALANMKLILSKSK